MGDTPEVKPNKSAENRNPDGTFGPGNIANPKGRPKGKTIKERVLEWLEDNPDDMKNFVEHFVKKNKELTWQMLEGRPRQDLEVENKGLPFTIKIVRDDGTTCTRENS